MKFSDILRNKKENVDSSIIKKVNNLNNSINEEVKTPEELLRLAGFKIRLITNTSFGKQIDFAKHYEKENIEKVLTGLNLKFKEKSVFIIS